MSLNQMTVTGALAQGNAAKLIPGVAGVLGGFQGDQWVSELLAQYHTLNLSQRLFSLDSDAVTLAAANTTKGNAGTIKLFNGFYNPVGSTVNAVVVYTIIPTVSGTPAGGYFFNFQNMGSGIGATVPTGTIRSANLQQGTTVGSLMTPLVNVVISRTDAAATAFTQLEALGGPTAVAVTGAVEQTQWEYKGMVIVGPGIAFGLAATGAGTTHILQSTMKWYELPV